MKHPNGAIIGIAGTIPPGHPGPEVIQTRMEFKVNANENVKVKLTEYGVEILRERHNKLYQGLNALCEAYPFELKLDDEGYYVTQLWILFSIFGNSMSMSGKLPFDMNIIIRNGEPTVHIEY